ncbi:MAG: hypothetical protein ABW049_07375 [Spongiibacteraceae bacterium]
MNPAADHIRTHSTHMEPTSTKSVRTDTPAWMQAKERGSDFWLRVMTRISLLVGRSCSRPILYGIALYFALFARKARRASHNYLSRCLGRPAGFRDFYRHVLAFSSTIHDRVFLLNDYFDRFDVQTFGTESLHADYNAGKGILLLGAHLGSFEVLRSIGRTSPGFNMYMAMYPDNARRINRALAAINPQATQDIIELGTLDAMLAISAKLDEGAYVGILADRAIWSRTTGAGEHRTLPFMGTPAQFPVGAFRLAAVLKRPVYFMTGVYCGGNSYEIHFEKLEDFSTPAPSSTSRNRDSQVHALMQKYVAALERNCRAHPLNWFNFYDFWHLEKN